MNNLGDEFPLLGAAGLYVKDTAGNGNCLFNALSDQMFGDESKHAELRSSVINHMRENGAYFKQFIEVHPGGGTRRNPKRKNAGGFSTPFSLIPATADDIDRTFESHLREMARGGTYGDNMEIVAFSSAFQIDVKIYQRDFAYVVSAKTDKAVVPVIHIAYHTWQHYSSIRNLMGPHTGLPMVKTLADYGAPEACPPKAAVHAPDTRPWNADAVRKKIDEGSGSVGDVISLLDHEKSTTPSTQGSSSVERELDSDDEEPIRGPNKRQDRRLSRATKIAASDNEDRSRELTYRPKGVSLATTNESSSITKPSHGIRSVAVTDSEDEEYWRKHGARKDSESTSFSTSASDISLAGKPRSAAGVRLKLSQPKKNVTPAKSASSNGRERPAVGAKAKTSTYKGTARVCPPDASPHRRFLPGHKRNFRSVKKPDASESNKVINTGPGTKPLKTTQGNERTPVIETQIKFYYI